MLENYMHSNIHVHILYITSATTVRVLPQSTKNINLTWPTEVLYWITNDHTEENLTGCQIAADRFESKQNKI